MTYIKTKNMKRNIPPYKVITWDHNKDDIEYYDVMPYFVNCWKYEKKHKRKTWNLSYDFNDNKKVDTTKMPESFDDFKKFILSNSQYMFWAKCEYEVIVEGWPKYKNERKIDVHQQIKNNIDVITKHFMDYINS